MCIGLPTYDIDHIFFHHKNSADHNNQEFQNFKFITFNAKNI